MMSSSISKGSTMEAYRRKGCPFLSNKIFSQFQRTSSWDIGEYRRRFASWKKVGTGEGQRLKAHWYRGILVSPLTSDLAKSGKVGSKPLPGLTCLITLAISVGSPDGSWLKNCPQGTPRISISSWCTSFSALKSEYWVAKPQ